MRTYAMTKNHARTLNFLLRTYFKQALSTSISAYRLSTKRPACSRNGVKKR